MISQAASSFCERCAGLLRGLCGQRVWVSNRRPRTAGARQPRALGWGWGVWRAPCPCSGDGIAGEVSVPCSCHLWEGRGGWDLLSGSPRVASGGASKGSVPIAKACPWHGHGYVLPASPGQQQLGLQEPYSSSWMQSQTLSWKRAGAFNPFCACLVSSGGRWTPMRWVAVGSSVSEVANHTYALDRV